MRNFFDIILADERLSFAFAVAISMHILLIFGISFNYNHDNFLRKSLDVTIAIFEDDKIPAKADFLAQNNQQGSGTLEEKAAPTTLDKTEWQDLIEENDLVALPNINSDTKTASQVVATHSEDDDKVVIETETDVKHDVLFNSQWQELVAQISSLEASIERERQEYASRPRVLRLHSASTMKVKEAAYIDAWKRKIERIGNINYPFEASRNKIYGKVMFKTVIGRDGSLLDADVIKTSGFTVLDQAVIDIVRLSAPFASFAHDIEDFDRLELIRTFCFSPGNKIKDCDK